MSARWISALLAAVTGITIATPAQVRAGPTLLARTETWDETGAAIADPSAVSLGPSDGRVFVSDATTGGAHRLWELDMRSGQIERALELGDVAREPAGISYHPDRGTLFVTDDDELALYEIDAAGQSLRAVDLGRLGARDPEGIAHDGERLYIGDGRGKQILVLSIEGKLLREVSLEPLGLKNAEGIAVDPATGHLFLVDDSPATLFELDREGALVGAYDLSPLGIVSPQGLCLAPTAPELPAPFGVRLLIADELIHEQPDGRVVEVALVRRPGQVRMRTSAVGDADGFGFRGDEAGFAGADRDRNGRLERGERLPEEAAEQDRRGADDHPATDSLKLISEEAPLRFEHRVQLAEGGVPVWARLSLTVADARALAMSRSLIRADGVLIGELAGAQGRRLVSGAIVETALELPPAALEQLGDGRLRIEIARPPGQGEDDLWLDYSRLEVAFTK